MTDQYRVKKFGEKLKKLRLTRELSLKELSTSLGYVSHSYISEVENGKKQPTVELVLKIARSFDVTTDYLLKDELDILTNERN